MNSELLGKLRWAELAILCVVLPLTTGWAQETREKVTVDDVDRNFMLRLPRGYDPERHYPVVILLHGKNQDPDDIERLTRFDELADKDGIITVYPAALHARWNVGVRPKERESTPMGPRRRRGGYGGGYPGGGYPGGGYPGGGGRYPGGQRPTREPEQGRQQTDADDVAFFNQMLDQIQSKFSVDASRIYSVGLSEGGFMSMRLGCALSDRIAAIGAVAAAMPKTMICLPTRPVAAVLINGTSDPVVPYGGGTEHNLNLATLSAEDSAKAWARINRCSDKPEKNKLSGHSKNSMETKVDNFAGCSENAQVTLYSVKGGGNTWPGGEQYEAENTVGKTDEGLNANELLWSFFVTRKLSPQSSSNTP